MSEEARWIKKAYMKPAIRLIETEWEGRRGSSFEVATTIWIDQHMPNYRIVIPEQLPPFCFGDPDMPLMPHEHIQTRHLTYVPTGRVVYDTTLPHERAIVYEYILEQMEKDLGK